MNILAIETSVAQASLCLYSGGEMKFSTSWQAERNHDAHLFPALQLALDSLPTPDLLDYILVGAGPGSYGGVRVALAAGVGISTVTQARLVALESWAQLAEADACVVADARRGGWTVRFPDGSIEVLSPEQLRQLPNVLNTVETAGVLSSKGIDNVRKEGLIPTAEGLVQTWLGMSESERFRLEEKPAEPIYVRPPHITAAAKKPWEI